MKGGTVALPAKLTKLLEVRWQKRRGESYKAQMEVERQMYTSLYLAISTSKQFL